MYRAPDIAIGVIAGRLERVALAHCVSELLLGGLISSAPLPAWLAPAGLILAGFCIAPVFSSQLAWFARTQPPQLAPYMLTLGGVGGALLPALTGLALPRLGVASVPLTSLIIAALLLASALLLHRSLKRQTRLR